MIMSSHSDLQDYTYKHHSQSSKQVIIKHTTSLLVHYIEVSFRYLLMRLKPLFYDQIVHSGIQHNSLFLLNKQILIMHW